MLKQQKEMKKRRAPAFLFFLSCAFRQHYQKMTPHPIFLISSTYAVASYRASYTNFTGVKVAQIFSHLTNAKFNLSERHTFKTSFKYLSPWIPISSQRLTHLFSSLAQCAFFIKKRKIDVILHKKL